MHVVFQKKRKSSVDFLVPNKDMFVAWHVSFCLLHDQCMIKLGQAPFSLSNNLNEIYLVVGVNLSCNWICSMFCKVLSKPKENDSIFHFFFFFKFCLELSR